MALAGPLLLKGQDYNAGVELAVTLLSLAASLSTTADGLQQFQFHFVSAPQLHVMAWTGSFAAVAGFSDTAIATAEEE